MLPTRRWMDCLPVLTEYKLTLQKGCRTVLEMQLLQCRLVLEQLQLGWRTCHVQIDHAFGPRRKIWQRLGTASCTALAASAADRLRC